ncbi:DUF6089 family protein [Odoribacter lunatus]|uniref:type IX secretion system protein PorG n=1 Tax=Odoribacter lunatus TaxID=2941335 RepID=UPI00203BAE74|nr:DUF6089 family protein [Odoribacter lunatus]
MYYRLFTSIIRFFIIHFLLFLLLFLPLSSFCQPGAEIGIIGGGGYYMGEYNPSTHFKGMNGYIGGLYRYNLNDRFAIRLQYGSSKIRVKSGNEPGEEVFPMELKTSVTDICGLVEFNFRSFLVPKTDKSSLWSPYIYVGAGLLSANDEGGISIPFGVGVKFNLYGNLSCGIEWGCRKLFTDKIDGIEDPWETGETNFIYNKDSFFVSGLTLTYRFPLNIECRGYK